LHPEQTAEVLRFMTKRRGRVKPPPLNLLSYSPASSASAASISSPTNISRSVECMEQAIDMGSVPKAGQVKHPEPKWRVKTSFVEGHVSVTSPVVISPVIFISDMDRLLYILVNLLIRSEYYIILAAVNQIKKRDGKRLKGISGLLQGRHSTPFFIGRQSVISKLDAQPYEAIRG